MPDRPSTSVTRYKVFKEGRNMKAIALAAMHDKIGNLLRRIAHPALGYVECYHSDGVIVLTIDKIDDQCGQVSLIIVGFAP